ncbi:MAG: DNA-protecting protein DprA [Gammaproteobacteria bacterium]|nr:DNA-protecting protein DprA [Gammaproteobacteria bacterium]
MDDKNLPYLLALARAPFIGGKIVGRIIHLFPCLEEFFNHGHDQLKLPQQTQNYLNNPDWKSVEHDLKWLNQKNNRFILTLADNDYPSLFREISSPPPLLFAHGNKPLLDYPQIAIVGSRNSSPNGREIAHQLAFELASLGLVITSGLAVGIDTQAHKGALQGGSTIAVIGTGINVVYPQSNLTLAEEIVERGLIISEFCCNTPPLAHNFPRRNRLISGLSLGTLVIEASLKSGSLITAQYALDQGRDVFAIPGSILNPRAKGCHYLLKQGAKLVESVEDIVEELGCFYPIPPNSTLKTPDFEEKRLDDDHRKLLECIDYEPTKIDIIIIRSEFSIQKVTSILIDLELINRVASTAGGYRRVS